MLSNVNVRQNSQLLPGRQGGFLPPQRVLTHTISIQKNIVVLFVSVSETLTASQQLSR